MPSSTPSILSSNVPKNMEAFNCPLSLSYTHEYTDLCVCFDNESLYRLCNKNLEIQKPTYDNFNELMAYLMQTLTSPMRHSGQLSAGLNDIVKNLAPFPGVKYVMPCMAPILSKNKVNFKSLDTAMLTDYLFRNENQFLNCNLQQGKFISCFLSYHGKDFDVADVENVIQKVKTRRTIQHLDCYPTELFKLAINTNSPSYSSQNMCSVAKSALLLSNTTAFEQKLVDIKEHFDKWLKDRAFMNKYLDSSFTKCDESELSYTFENIQNIVKEYADLENL